MYSVSKAYRETTEVFVFEVRQKKIVRNRAIVQAWPFGLLFIDSRK